MSAKMTEARKRANQKWDAENLKRISLAMLTPDYNEMMVHIAKKGKESRNGFINRAIKATIAADNQDDGNNK